MRSVLAAYFVLATTYVPVLAASSYDEINAGIEANDNLEWSAALSHMQTALKAGDLAPGLQYVAHVNIGYAQLGLHHPDLAVPEFSAGLALRPRDRLALWARAESFLEQDRLDDAAADMDAVVAQNPYFDLSYLRRALINTRRGHPDMVAKDLALVRSRNEDDFGKRREIGIIEMQAGHYEDASADLVASLQGYRNVYSWLWLTVNDAHIGRTMRPEMLPRFDHKLWPGPVTDFFLGTATRDAVLSAATQDASDKIKAEHLCDAYLYMGEWLISFGKPADARDMLQKAGEECAPQTTGRFVALQDARKLP